MASSLLRGIDTVTAIGLVASHFGRFRLGWRAHVRGLVRTSPEIASDAGDHQDGNEQRGGSIERRRPYLTSPLFEEAASARTTRLGDHLAGSGAAGAGLLTAVAGGWSRTREKPSGRGHGRGGDHVSGFCGGAAGGRAAAWQRRAADLGWADEAHLPRLQEREAAAGRLTLEGVLTSVPTRAETPRRGIEKKKRNREHGVAKDGWRTTQGTDRDRSRPN